ncbi:uncharacterized protein LOC141700605 [Apium graveolens]|uniref:uncharacterized protein LOC141700605 n=1 Tax=Apium graveolens TaxID=4045 RepID=UPI003D796C26
MGTSEDITNAANYLKNEFEMKGLGKTKFCLGIQVEHLSSGIFVYQSTYTEKVLDRFYMDKSHPLTTPMVVRSLEVEKDPFRPRKEDEDPLGPEVPYLVQLALLYTSQTTHDLILLLKGICKTDANVQSVMHAVREEEKDCGG